MYYIASYHTHKLVITLFILIYLVKFILLMSGKHKTLESFSARIKIPEIIVSSLFLITGVSLLFETAEISGLMVAKIIVVGLSIPVAIKAYRGKNKLLAALSFLMIIGAYGMAEMNKYMIIHTQDLPSDVVTDASDPAYSMVIHGKALYDTQCINCHGADGTLQMSGANNLRLSKMTEDQIVERINTGKMTMPPYDDFFTNHEKKAISEYILSLQDNQGIQSQ